MSEQRYIRKRETADSGSAPYTADRAGDPFLGMAAQAGNQAMLSLFGGNSREAAASERRVDLPSAMRAKMEAAFGADFSNVRLYENPAVADAGANAVTSGSKISFAPGALDFTSFHGQALLGHELSHVVSQSLGESRGQGFLNDPGLEARADREGAMAAAGAVVSAGASPIVAPPVFGGGPVQASLNDKKKPSLHPVAAQPVEEQNPLIAAQPVVEQAPPEDPELAALGEALNGANDNNQALINGFQAERPKRNLLSRAFRAIGRRIAKSHRAAVDNYNNYTADFKRMGRWSRFKWALANPIAWLRGGSRSSRKDTEARNNKRSRLNAIADLLKGYYANRRGDDLTDENMSLLEAPEEQPQALENPARAEQNEAAPGGIKGFFKKAAALPGKAARGVGSLVKKVAGGVTDHAGTIGKLDRLACAPIMLHNAKTVKKAVGGLGSLVGSEKLANSPGWFDTKLGGDISTGVEGGLCMLASLGSLPGDVKGLEKNIGVGDTAETVGSALSMADDMLWTGKSGLGITNQFFTPKALAASLGKVDTSLGVASGAFKMAGAASKFVGAAKTHHKLKHRMNHMTEEERAYEKTMRQGRRFSKANMLSQGVGFLSGATTAARGIGSLTGIGALTTVPLYVAGNIISDLGGAGVNAVKSSMKHSTVEESMGLARKMKFLKQKLKGLSDDDAKYVALRGMGVESGSRSDAFEMITKIRAGRLRNDALDGKTAANNIVRDMNISNVGSRHSLGALITKLGGNADWKKKKANPFAP